MRRLSAIATPSFGGGRAASASQGELAMSASEIDSAKRKTVGSFNGPSGAALAWLRAEMARRDAEKGLATLCIGGGMGVAARGGRRAARSRRDEDRQR
jgi:acetyl-CoA acetyltransferase